MTKFIITIAALVTLSACGKHTMGNAYMDYRATSFATVNHCLHNTHFGC